LEIIPNNLIPKEFEKIEKKINSKNNSKNKFNIMRKLFENNSVRIRSVRKEFNDFRKKKEYPKNWNSKTI